MSETRDSTQPPPDGRPPTPGQASDAAPAQAAAGGTDRPETAQAQSGTGRATIRDVARAAGVARATVSAILNDRPHCYASAQTRRRVHEAADRLGYRPTPMAQALMGKPSGTLGLIITGFDVEPTAQRLVGFENAVRPRSQVALVLTTANVPEAEDQAIQRLIDRYADGIAVYPTETGPHHELRRLVERGFPVVTLDGAGRLDFETYDVTPDYHQAGELQAQHLIDQGRRRIGLISGVERCFVNDRKIEGVIDTLQAAGLELVEHIQLSLPLHANRHWITDEFEQLRDVLRDRGHHFDALATVGDLYGLAVIRIATELGMRVPDDLAVSAVDGLAAASQGAIPLTTVRHDSEEVGQIAFDMLMRRISGELTSSAPERHTMPMELVPRASTIGAPTKT